MASESRQNHAAARSRLADDPVQSHAAKQEIAPNKKAIKISVNSGEPLFVIHVGETTIVIGRSFGRVLISIFAMPMLEPASKLMLAALKHFGS